MKITGKITAILLIIGMLMTGVSAENLPLPGLNEFDKSSYSDYLGENLSCTEEELVSFDDASAFSGAEAVEGKKGGAVSFTAKKDEDDWTVINMPTDSFHISVEDKFRQTIKMWVYVSDMDLMECDHDSVYDDPQVGSGTLWITLSDHRGGVGHLWMHTFYGSGWHEIELAFDCHNVAYDNLSKIDYSDLTTLKVRCIADKGLELRFDDMRLCTYDNPNYTQPEAPYGGRWLSTCDYDALDGVILTEWYGSCFDLENKTQGSSSVRITGHKENVDHRVCIAIDDVPVSYEEDTICFDMYIEDPALLGDDWQIRFEHNASIARYTLNYDIVMSSVVDDQMRGTFMKAGWNHIQIELSDTTVNIADSHKSKFSEDLVITQLCFYIAGTGTNDEENYVINYDNFYVAKTADLKAAKAEMKAQRQAAEDDTAPTDEPAELAGENEGENMAATRTEIGLARVLAIAAILVVVVAAAVIVVIVLVKKRKK